MKVGRQRGVSSSWKSVSTSSAGASLVVPLDRCDSVLGGVSFHGGGFYYVVSLS
jgi:hypothetical protein